MEELRIKIKLDFKDFLNFQYGYLRKRFANRLLLIGSILLFITVLLPVFLGQSIGHLEQFIPSFIFILFIPTLLIVATYYAAKKNFDNDPQLRKEQSYIFDSSGIQFSTESSQMKYRWDELFKFDESKSNLLIYCSPLKSFILPKNQLSEQEIIWLRELCSLNIKKQAFGTNSIFPTKVRIVIIIVPILIGVFIGLYPKKSTRYSEREQIGENSTGKKSIYLFSDGYEMIIAEDYENAIPHFDELILRDSTHYDAYTFRGFAKAMLKNYEGAILDLNKAIALKADYATPWYYRAYAKEAMEDIEGACSDYRKAAELGSTDAEKSVARLCK